MKEALKKLNQVIQPYLDKENTAFKVMSRKKNGYSSRGFNTIVDDEIKSHAALKEADMMDAFEEINDLFADILKENGSVNGKSAFCFKKGEDAIFKDFTLEDAVEEIVINTRREMKKNGFEKVQTVCGFYLDDDYLKSDCKTSSFKDAEVETKNYGTYVGMYKDCEVIYYKLEGGLKEILLEITDSFCKISSNPPQPELGWDEIIGDSFQVSKKIAVRHDAIRESVRLRDEAFRKIGHMDDTVFAPLISPVFMGGSSWPGGRPQYRLIQTAKSTLLMTDGISNCFEDEKVDAELKYNGYGVEFYMEFKGNIGFDEFQGHYAHAVLNQVSQSAIGHGEFVRLFKKFGPVSIQLSGIDLSKKYLDKEGNCGVLMLVPSGNVPAKVKLNKENVLLVGCRLLTKTELKQCANDSDHSVKKGLVEKYKTKKEFCFSPFECRVSE